MTDHLAGWFSTSKIDEYSFGTYNKPLAAATSRAFRAAE